VLGQIAVARVDIGVVSENGIYGHSRFATPILTTSWLA